MNKHAASLWVAWVLLIVFIVAIATAVGNWLLQGTKNYVESFKEQVNGEECNFLYLRPERICQDLSAIDATISNPSGKSVNGFKVVLFDIYGNVETKKVDFDLYRSTYNQKLTILKDEVVESVELIPFMDIQEKDGIRRIYCQNRKIVKSKVPFCDENR